MQLNAEEIAQLRRGERLDIEIAEVGERCVVMRSTDLARLFAMTLDGLPQSVISELVDVALAEDDVHDPWLASYQTCRP